MAVTEVKLHSAGGSGGATGTDAGAVQATYTTRYRAKTDDPLDQAPIVLAHFQATSTLPWFGRNYSYGNVTLSGMVCRDIQATYVEGSYGWFEVVCKFEPVKGVGEEPESGRNEDGEITEDPLDWRDEISVAFTQFSEAMEEAVFFGGHNTNGLSQFLKPGAWQAVTNSAGVPFDPLPESERDIKIIRITRRVPRYDNFLFGNFQGTTNSDNFTIDKPAYRFSEFVTKQRALLRLDNAFDMTNGIKNWRQTAEFWIHPRSWRKFLLDRGNEELFKPGDVDDDGTSLSASDFPADRPFDLRKLKDEEGYPTVAPILLNGKGRRLSLNPPRRPVFLEYSDLVERPFGGLVGAAW